MMKLNNKGQSLILFIILIPILLGIMALVIDVGNALTKKNETDNIVEYVLDYGLNNSEVFFENKDKEYLNENLINLKDNLVMLLNYNLKNNNNEVAFVDNSIIITSNTYVQGIFSNILNIKGFKIESEYKGHIQNDEKIIKKVK